MQGGRIVRSHVEPPGYRIAGRASPIGAANSPGMSIVLSVAGGVIVAWAVRVLSDVVFAPDQVWRNPRKCGTAGGSIDAPSPVPPGVPWCPLDFAIAGLIAFRW